MALIFSCEEKARILSFADEHSLNGDPMEDENKWKDLGVLMNRPWDLIRDKFRYWKLENPQQIDVKLENDSNEYVDACVEVGHDINLKEIITNPDCDINEILLRLTCDNIVDGNNQHDNNADHHASTDGQLIDNYIQYMNENQYLNADTEVICNNNVEDQNSIFCKKHQLDPTFFDEKILDHLEQQSRDSLELRRKEHEMKMKIYKMQIQQGAEIHREKMKILKVKLKEAEEKVHQIDHVLCNNNLKKKFRSGPI